MAYQFQSVGTVAIKNCTTGGDTISPGAPSGLTTGNLILLLVYTRQTNTGVTAAGFQQLVSVSTRLRVFARIATGTEDTPVVTVTQSNSGYVHAQYARFSGSYPSVGVSGADILQQAAATATASANDIITAALGSTPGTNGCLIIYAGSKLNDMTATASSRPNSSTLIAENRDVTSSLTSVWSYTIQTTAAAVGASLFDYSDADTNTYYSAVLALLPAAENKYVKLLAHPSAASATGVEGVVLNSTRDTVIGEFSGQAFEASLEGGESVLLIDVTDITPDGSTLTTTDTPLVSAYNSTDGTVGLGSATVIEV
jgi:hypothetical protein